MEYEFGGPIGGIGIIIGLPLVICMLYFGCTPTECIDSFPNAIKLPSLLYDGLSRGFADGGDVSLWSWEAVLIVFGWTALHFILCESYGARVENLPRSPPGCLLCPEAAATPPGIDSP